MNAEEVKSKINNFLTKLTEEIPGAHVQVLMTWNLNGLTYAIDTGKGNWYARQGMAHEFINADIAQGNARQIAQQIDPPHDGGEEWKKL